ncbi:MAG: SWIM zinc finger family protein [Gemmatimonadales bacterium]
MSKRPHRTRSDRVAQYVDSPLMTHRLLYQRHVSARILGNYGIYRTEVSLRPHGEASCTCPADQRPCKHVPALRATWKLNPASFFDLDALLQDLSTRPKASMLTAIARMALAAPECLSALGVVGFEAEPGDDVWVLGEAPPVTATLEPLASRLTRGPARPMTPLQAQYLAFIQAYVQLNGRPPAEADLQRYFKVTPPTVHQMVVTLDKKGWIARTPGRARSIKVLIPRDELPELA